PGSPRGCLRVRTPDSWPRPIGPPTLIPCIGPAPMTGSSHGPARRRQPRPLGGMDPDPRPLGVLRRRGVEVGATPGPAPPAGRGGRRGRRQGPAPPAVPLRAGHPGLGEAGGEGHRGRLLGAGRRAGPGPGRRHRPGRPLRGLGRGRPPGQPRGRLRRRLHLLRGAELAARPPPLDRGGPPLRPPGRLLLHRRGPPVRLGLRRRRGRHRAAPALPLLAAPGAAGLRRHRALRPPRPPGGGAGRARRAPPPALPLGAPPGPAGFRRPGALRPPRPAGGGAGRVRLAAQHGRDRHLPGHGRAAHRLPARARLGRLADVPVHGRDRLERVAAPRARRRPAAPAVLAQGDEAVGWSRAGSSREDQVTYYGAAPPAGSLLAQQVLIVKQKLKLVELRNEYAVLDQYGRQIGAVLQATQSPLAFLARGFTSWDVALPITLHILGPGTVPELTVHKPWFTWRC